MLRNEDDSFYNPNILEYKYLIIIIIIYGKGDVDIRISFQNNDKLFHNMYALLAVFQTWLL